MASQVALDNRASTVYRVLVAFKEPLDRLDPLDRPSEEVWDHVDPRVLRVHLDPAGEAEVRPPLCPSQDVARVKFETPLISCEDHRD